MKIQEQHIDQRNGLIYWEIYFQKQTDRMLTHKEWGDINALIDTYLKQNL